MTDAVIEQRVGNHGVVYVWTDWYQLILVTQLQRPTESREHWSDVT